MAGFGAFAAVGKSVERALNAAFEEAQPVNGKKTGAHLARSQDLDVAKFPFTLPALTIFVYRADFNKTMRAAWSAVGSIDGRARLPVDLHFLLTAWGENAEHELLIIGRAMQYLETVPILSGPLLFPPSGPPPNGEWLPNEAIQITLEDISTDILMRTFDSLSSDYKLSVPYVARVVRVDGRVPTPDPTTTSRITGLRPEPSP